MIHIIPFFFSLIYLFLYIKIIFKIFVVLYFPFYNSKQSLYTNIALKAEALQHYGQFSGRLNFHCPDFRFTLNVNIKD